MGLMGFVFLGESFGCFTLQPFKLHSQMPFPVKLPVSYDLPGLRAGELRSVMETPILYSAKKDFSICVLVQVHTEKPLHCMLEKMGDSRNLIDKIL